MRFACVISRSPDGRWQARHNSREAGQVRVQAGTREEVVEKVRDEIRYRLELCPCTGDTWQHVDIDVVEE